MSASTDGNSILWFSYLKSQTEGVVCRGLPLIVKYPMMVYTGLAGALNFILVTFLWVPLMTIRRACFNAAMLPIDILLYPIMRTTVRDIIKTSDITVTLAIIRILVQYMITITIIGVFMGLFLGVLLGATHRLLRIPELNVTIMPKYIEGTIGSIGFLKELFARITERGLRSIPVMPSGTTEDDADNLFADLLDTYEYEYKRLEGNKANNFVATSPSSVRELESHSSDVSGLSNIFDSVQETGTVRTDIEEMRTHTDRKKKGYSSGYYESLDIKELHHRK